MPLTELQNNIRRNIIEDLDLLASPEKQLEYQREVPIADVTAELFCSWDEHYYPTDSETLAAFSRRELDALAQFDAVLQESFATFQGEFMPWIELF